MLCLNEVPSECRWCAYCQQPFPASREFFNRGHGRFGLHTICRTCQVYNDRVVNRFKREHGPPPEACEICHAVSKLECDHDHETNEFRAWVCRACNLRSRRQWTKGPHQVRLVV